MHASCIQPEASNRVQITGWEMGIGESGKAKSILIDGHRIISMCATKLNALLEQLIPNFRGTRHATRKREGRNGLERQLIIDERNWIIVLWLHLCTLFRVSLHVRDTRTVFIGPVKRDLIRFLFSSSSRRSVCVHSVSRAENDRSSVRFRRLIAVHFSLSATDSVSIKLHLHNFRVVAAPCKSRRRLLCQSKKKKKRERKKERKEGNLKEYSKQWTLNRFDCRVMQIE